MMLALEHLLQPFGFDPSIPTKLVAATFIGQLMGFYPEGHPAGFIASVLGAVVLLVIYHLIARKSQ